MAAAGLLLVIALLPGQSLAFDEGAAIGIGPPASVVPKLEPVAAEPAAICRAIELQARRFGFGADFFARLIFQESRFDANAVSPKGAEGIAQFMPATARARGLADSFDIAAALYHSAAYLREHRRIFGNWGLAAAAYNAGPNRVRRWLAGESGLPAETEGFVYKITGAPAATFRERQAELGDLRLDDKLSFLEACEKLPVRRTSPKVAGLQSGPWHPWGAQVAGSFSQAAALAAFERIRARAGGLIDDTPPMVVRDRTPGRGRAPVYAVRIGMDSRQKGAKLCFMLRAKGLACVIMKNR
ncbi:lytic transglycosylase domain-containing protein [Afifella sp. IM 167]|uniref:lytic transglycosylase domain-containing protein n=1 Tax=Afifella sp. IM 167 TaxID=2033586 RepID=UPI001CCAABAC